MPALDELASVNLRYNTSPGSKGSGSAGSGSLMRELRKHRRCGAGLGCVD
jgi:hypothetical protein